MSRFAALLTEIDERLNLHQPAKGRILLEIAADIHDLFDYYQSCGMSEEAAQAAAEENFDISDDVLADLIQLHQTRYQRFIDRLSVQAPTRWERTSLALLVMIMAFSGGPVIVGGDILRQSSPIVWPMLGIGIAGLALGLRLFQQLFIKKNHRSGQRRRGMSVLLGLSVSSIILGVFGFAIELYLALKRLMFSSEGLWSMTIDWLLRGAPVFLLGLLTAMVIALIWFVLINRIQKIEQAEVEYLLTA
ncbi:hypothetical protein ACFL3H_08490 [Gemmatimonadota bacterium]